MALDWLVLKITDWSEAFGGEIIRGNFWEPGSLDFDLVAITK